jgi:hypothetical protein
LIELKEERDKVKRSRRRAYNRLSHDQNIIRKQSIDVSMLVEAMRNLPNLEVIIVYGNSDASSVWGANEIRKMTGICSPSAPNRQQMRHRADLLKRLIKRTPASLLQCYPPSRQVVSSSENSVLGLLLLCRPRLPATPNDRSRSFIPRQTLSEAHIELLKPAFSQLKKLHLTAISWKDDSGELVWITRFLSLCPNLEDLCLAVPQDSAQFISRISQFQLFPKIRVLGFTGITFSSKPSHELAHQSCQYPGKVLSS